MMGAETKIEAAHALGKLEPPMPVSPGSASRRRASIYPTALTMGLVASAALVGRAGWRVYMETPWTRDATVRAYVVVMAPEVSGRIVELRVHDNQLVHKGDLLMEIDPINYRVAQEQANANLVRSRVSAEDARKKATRRQQLSDLAASSEERETYASAATVAEASVRVAQANLDLARADMERTRVLSPVDGYVTNLQARLGDYAVVGQKSVSIVDANSFWIDGYFEESNLRQIHEGDGASIHLLGDDRVIHGHVESVARGITVTNAQQDGAGLATVNPVFTWVRLAQRVPVRIGIDQIPRDTRLIAGLTATVRIDPAPDGSGLKSEHAVCEDQECARRASCAAPPTCRYSEADAAAAGSKTAWIGREGAFSTAELRVWPAR